MLCKFFCTYVRGLLGLWVSFFSSCWKAVQGKLLQNLSKMKHVSYLWECWEQRNSKAEKNHSFMPSFRGEMWQFSGCKNHYNFWLVWSMGDVEENECRNYRGISFISWADCWWSPQLEKRLNFYEIGFY